MNIVVEEEVFLEAVDYLQCEGEEDSVDERSEYGIWTTMPRGVQERREAFLREAGFIQHFSDRKSSSPNPSQTAGLRRMGECTGTLPPPSASPNWAEGESVSAIRIDANEPEHDETRPLGRERFECPSSNAHNPNLSCSKTKIWWKRLMNRKPMPNSGSPSKATRIKVGQTNKSCTEFSALYAGRQIHGHDGCIWAMKFSPDGQYLASGGQDGVVRVWSVVVVDASHNSVDASHNSWTDELAEIAKSSKKFSERRRLDHASIALPQKLFRIEERPLLELRGHASDVLDLAWSNNNCLLSASKDKTVRLWEVDHGRCLHAFCHSNYVTCIQFNPTDENFFISGSVDGKVRIWCVRSKRVIDWVGARDVVTALSYQPHGKGFVVGSITGTCCFYDLSGNHVQLSARIQTRGRRKTLGNKITGIQFPLQEPQRVMITSQDLKVRIYDGIGVVQKFKVARKTWRQKSASFTSTGKHIISVGGDSRVYVWNYDGSTAPSSKHPKSIQLCEHFPFEGVSVAIPWPGMGNEEHGLGTAGSHPNSLLDNHLAESSLLNQTSKQLSLRNWFRSNGPGCRLLTWPEEQLPSFTESKLSHPQRCKMKYKFAESPTSWRLVIVAASSDGTIRTFQNYGLPVRL